MKFEVEGLDHVVLNVSDPETSATWYRDVLGMTVEETTAGSGTASRLSVEFGSQKLNLRPVAASQEKWFTADYATAGSDDLCFLTLPKPEDVVAHLERLGVNIEQGPVEKSGARGQLISIYCRDPDGSLIEISSYKE